MITLPLDRREMRYGVPAADQILFNREYAIGYSYYFRQAKWALEVVDRDNTEMPSEKQVVERMDNFRSDYRIPQAFRADKADYINSGYDRGHLVCSANKRDNVLENSETFLLSNMCPQTPELNRQKWRVLEEKIRAYDGRKEIFETFVISGPIFYFDREITTIGSLDDNGVTVPVPHAFFKSVLAEDNRGNLKMWSFILPNQASNIEAPLEDFLVPTTKVEMYSGLRLWDNLVGTKMERERSRIRKAKWLSVKT